MTRLKKYIIDKGFKLASNYEYLPYQIQGHFMHPDSVVLIDVIIDVEKARLYEVLNIGTVIHQVERNGSIEVIDFV